MTRNPWTDSFFHQIAARLDLNISMASETSARVLSGWIKGHYFELEQQGKLALISYLYDIRGPDWSLAAEPVFSKEDREKNQYDIQCGQDSFDAHTLIECEDSVHILSLLNSEFRSSMAYLQYISDKLLMTNASLEIHISSSHIDETQKLLQIIDQVTALPGLLHPGEDDYWRLTYNTLHDRDINIRKNNMYLLQAHYSERPDITATFKKALQDKDKDMVIMAAIYLKQEGLPLLKGMLSKGNLKQEQALKLIDHFSQPENQECLPALIDYYEEHRDVELRLNILEGLSRSHNPGIQSFLLRKLKANTHPRLEQELIRTLGACGDKGAIEALSHLLQAGSSPGLKNSILEAIAAIQSRLDLKGDKGWLSVTDTDESAGRLSLPGQTEGGLSFRDEK